MLLLALATGEFRARGVGGERRGTRSIAAGADCQE